DERHTGGNQLRPRGLDLYPPRLTAPPPPTCPCQPDPVIRAPFPPVFQLRPRHCRAGVPIPQRRRPQLIGGALCEQAQERRVRDALRVPVNRCVGHAPVDGETQLPPQLLEDLLVLLRQALAELDEVRPRHGNRALLGLRWRLEARDVRQRRIAFDP